jgi:hypothetical protein
MVLVQLSQRAQSTLASLQERHPQAVLQQSPFCFESEHGEVRGWALDVPVSAPCSVLPVGSNLGDGVGCFELELTGQQVLEHLCEASRLQANLAKVVKVLCDVDHEEDTRASWWRCSPKEGCSVRILKSASRGADGKVRFVRSEMPEVPVVDSEPWEPELSANGFVGLYHHYDAHACRERLYLVVSSYLQKACLEFTGMVQELGKVCTVDEVAQSQELHWLRQACKRNRARLAYLIATAMDLPVKVTCDHYASDRRNTRLALAITDTMYTDLQSVGAMVRVLNHCTNTRDICNGSLCVMAPWEGIWVFHGHNAVPTRASARFGHPYGHFYLPTHAPKLSEEAMPKQSAYVLTYRRPEVGKLRLEEPPVVTLQGDLVSQAMQMREHRRRRREGIRMALLAPQARHRDEAYLRFDESVLQYMVEKGWARSLGYTAMKPLAYAAA